MLAVVHTALAFALYTYGVRHLGAGRAAIEPVVAGATGVFLLSEAVTAPKILGALLVLTGAALTQTGGPQEPERMRSGEAGLPLAFLRRSRYSTAAGGVHAGKGLEEGNSHLLRTKEKQCR